MKDWTRVYISKKPHVIALVKGLLEENNIDSVVINKQDSLYLIGDIELYVPVHEAFNANQIINTIQSE